MSDLTLRSVELSRLCEYSVAFVPPLSPRSMRKDINLPFVRVWVLAQCGAQHVRIVAFTLDAQV
ncbi:hypothetical protein CEQ23_00210 (plasmid) [Burkholderia cepacia]|nr:hypothetical protein CEQ23_00210 [Burkholderia cepacia]